MKRVWIDIFDKIQDEHKLSEWTDGEIVKD